MSFLLKLCFSLKNFAVVISIFDVCSYKYELCNAFKFWSVILRGILLVTEFDLFPFISVSYIDIVFSIVSNDYVCYNSLLCFE